MQRVESCRAFKNQQLSTQNVLFLKEYLFDVKIKSLRKDSQILIKARSVTLLRFQMNSMKEG